MRRLLLHARDMGASAEEAEDLVHDAVELVVRESDWYDPARGTLLGALKVVVRNRYLNRIRAWGVQERAVPRLQVVPPGATPESLVEGADAVAHRRRLLALLEPDERALFAAWLKQRSGSLTGSQAARTLGMHSSAYEAAKKRLRRRCRALLDELELDPADLFGAGSAQTGEGG